MISNRILGMRVDPVTLEETINHILAWAVERQGRMVCAADVHLVMRHRDEADFRETMTQADLVTPDGMPLVWLLRRQGFPGQERVCGPDLTLELCGVAAEKEIPVGFYGGRPEVLQALVSNLRSQFPSLMVAYSYSPPFRPLTAAEDEAETIAINEAGVRLLFVGLGCPKQERWMAAHKGQISTVMLGVGAAFDFHAGSIRRAPSWVQRIGLEWLFRVGADPKRLAKRAFQYYPRFIWHVMTEGLKRTGNR
ncbi:UDP-N-acetyl-D-mannosaminuronic acid transferase [Geothrix rubra]|uniref:UDP-N-acetyl-D-mannosaminuronic acid transferase n=1 Tax=Geothrix rubra TaxID=2927977 RepID=A0ABQ5Q8A6_9BACT|nr:WecB/TagA/CpsF family glycosyltransferase [Geothrix rubra]GLH70656.1 UDP-N-acetyl-D-mannosaminuronic acid transferase [Geothrix rubra]